MQKKMDDAIDTQKKLKMLVYDWSVTRGLDPAIFQAFAESILPDIESRPLLKEGVERLLHHFHGRVLEGAESARRASLVLQNISASWELETVKHLSIVNTAGIAGCAALLTRWSDLSSFSYALIIFSAGLLMSLITLWFGAEAYLNVANNAQCREREFKQASSWGAYCHAMRPIQTEKFKFWNLLARGSGWAAAACALAGMLFVIYGLLHQ